MAVKQILLAEDDKDDQFFFIDFLKDRKDFILLPIAENGIEIIEILEKTEQSNFPDVIILDQNMPKQNGLQTLLLLKEDNRYKQIPVFLYSTFVNEYLSEQSLKTGAVKVLSKPSDHNGYDKMMDEILSMIS